jgi:hypothetical protein
MGRAISEDKIARLRVRYQAGESVAAIGKAEDVAASTVINYAKRLAWARPPGHRAPRFSKARPFAKGGRCPGLSVCPLRSDLVTRLYALVRAQIDADAGSLDLKQSAALAATLDRLVRAEATGARSGDHAEGSNAADLAADADRIRGELLARARRLADAGTAGPQAAGDHG